MVTQLEPASPKGGTTPLGHSRAHGSILGAGGGRRGPRRPQDGPGQGLPRRGARRQGGPRDPPSLPPPYGQRQTSGHPGQRPGLTWALLAGPGARAAAAQNSHPGMPGARRSPVMRRARTKSLFASKKRPVGNLLLSANRCAIVFCPAPLGGPLGRGLGPPVLVGC